MRGRQAAQDASPQFRAMSARTTRHADDGSQEDPAERRRRILRPVGTAPR